MQTYDLIEVVHINLSYAKTLIRINVKKSRNYNIDV